MYVHLLRWVYDIVGTTTSGSNASHCSCFPALSIMSILRFIKYIQWWWYLCSRIFLYHISECPPECNNNETKWIRYSCITLPLLSTTHEVHTGISCRRGYFKSIIYFIGNYRERDCSYTYIYSWSIARRANIHIIGCTSVVFVYVL